MTGGMYAGAMVLLIFGWPALFPGAPDIPTQNLFWPYAAVNTFIAVLIWYYNGMEDLSFFAA